MVEDVTYCPGGGLPPANFSSMNHRNKQDKQDKRRLKARKAEAEARRAAAQKQSLAAMRRAVTKEDQKTYHAARVVLPALANNVRPGKRGPLPAGSIKSFRLHAAYEAWVRSLHYPSGNRGIQCPINENPAPSNIVLSATTTWNNDSVIVDPGRCVQIIIFPGRDVQAAGTVSYDNCANPAGTLAVTEPGPGDEVAVHSKFRGYCASGQVVPDTVVAVSPVPVVAVVNVAGVATSVEVGNVMGLISYGDAGSDPLNSGHGTCWAGGAPGATGAGKWLGMVPDNQLGIKADTDTGHLRWKLTSCDIYARNTTPEASRGGNITTAMPSNRFYESVETNQTFPQAKLDRYGTFRVHADEAYVAWVPRPGELAFSHAATSQQQATSALQGLHFSATPYFEGAGIFMFLNNPTSSRQTYRVSVCQNFDMAGQAVSQLGRTAEHHPQLMPAVQAGVAIATGGNTSIGHAMALGAERASEGAISAASSMAGVAARFARGLVSHAADTLGTAVKGAILAA